MQKPEFSEALTFWLKLGFISFGGPAGQLAIMHKYLVEEKKWISERRYMHALNYCMLLPGPEAQQMATYTGWLLHGLRGGLAAGILFILPSVFILLGLSILYVVSGNEPWVKAVFDGLKPAVLAIIFAMVFKLAGSHVKLKLQMAVAALAFISIYFLKIPFPLVILGALLVGVIYASKNKTNNEQITNNLAWQAKEKSYYINSLQPAAEKRSWGWAFFVLAICVMLWLIPFMLLNKSGDGQFWEPFIFFFTKSALVTFGGAYSVLQYVAQVSVEKFGWLTSLQMVDGLALGESTPGPLIMVLAFVGFMAGYNYAGHSLGFGSLGLLVTVFYTFLPCFFFIFAGAPLIERTRNNSFVKAMLDIIKAAITGVLLSLAVYLFQQILFVPKGNYFSLQYFHFGWFLISLVALQYFKINMLKWLAVSVVFGGVLFVLQNHFLVLA